MRELGEVIAAKQEKALVFTQFREVTAPLASFLGGVFGRPGLVLHGETEVKKRQDLVKRFQEDEEEALEVQSQAESEEPSEKVESEDHKVRMTHPSRAPNGLKAVARRAVAEPSRVPEERAAQA